ncbi:MAG: helix-turn-helix domain-containing protein [SAR324 cluster bacterium]|nr:helix-turn-helix domain-containing protein [SAR324 cluster bacterium]
MRRRKGYGQFCPVAKAAEIFAERWTPLVLRELLAGSRRFNDLRRGVPLMSQSMLAQRLRELEWAGIVERRQGTGKRGADYHLTPAGEELRPVIEQLGTWGYRWAQSDLKDEDLDAGLLMWDMQRRNHLDRLPPRRVVVHFRFHDAGRGKSFWWLVLEPGEVDLCLKPPGYQIDLTVECDVRTMVLVWLGDLSLAEAQRSHSLRLEGPRPLREGLPRWLALTGFAATPLHDRSVRPRPGLRTVLADSGDLPSNLLGSRKS